MVDMPDGIKRVGARASGSGGVFGLVVGLFLGVLLASLLGPARRVEVVGAGAAAPRAGAGGEAAGAAPGDAGTTTTSVVAVGADGVPAASGPAAGAARAATSTGARAGGGAPAGGAPAGGAATVVYTGDKLPVVAERGVTKDEVTIGVALIDTGPLGAAPQFNQGEPEDFYESMLKAWEREGKNPIHGRKIKFVYKRYSVLDSNEQRAACINLIQDRKSFAIIGTVLFQVGGDCVAKENQTPSITSDSTYEQSIARGAPYLFSLAMSEDRQLRNVAHWAHTRKHIVGQKVGVYYSDEAVESELVNRTLIGELEKLGYTVVKATTNSTQAGQNDLLAVRRFQGEDVKTVIMLAVREGFLNAAKSQGYKPRYLDTDHNYGTTDSSTTRFPADQYEGTLAFTGRRGGEFQAKYPRTPEQNTCVGNFKAYKNEVLVDDTFKFQMAMHSCDAANAVYEAIKRAGPNLTRASYVAALETFKNIPLARSGSATFGPGKHHGTDAFRTIKWQSDCLCFRAIQDFEPLLVP